MPYKSDKIAINNEKLDKRVKLSKEQKEEIFNLFQTGNYTQTSLAKMYGVSRRTISFIVNPESLEVARQQYKERRKDGRYYDKEKHKKAISIHRKHKYKLFNDGKIK